MANRRFTVTEEHLKLLGRLNIRFEEYVEYGAPAVDPKRPYGNSSVDQDIYEILEWEPEEIDDYGDPEFDHDRAYKIHQEMTDVLQILVQHVGEPILGEWEEKQYYSKWSKV